MAVRLLLTVIGLLLAPIGTAWAADEYVDNPPALIDRLTPDVLVKVFPDAGRLAPVEGPPPAVAVYDDSDTLIGYIFSTLDVVRARGYTLTPFDVLAGIRANGEITGATIVFNPEPHINGDERRTSLLTAFFERFVGAPYNRLSDAAPRPDFVAGATISARAMRYAIGDAARIVMRGLYGAPVVTEPTLDSEGYVPMTVDELLVNGSIRSLRLTNADIEAALADAGASGATLDMPLRGEPDDLYIEFFAALGTPPTISHNLVNSQPTLDRILSDRPEGTQQIFLGSNGRYNFQGVSFQNASTGHLFDRVELVQGDTVYVFHGEDYERAPSKLAPYSGILMLGPDSGFDPLQPWTAVLKVHGTAADGSDVTLSFPLEYELPAAYVLMPEPEPEPVWLATWRDNEGKLIVLGVALVVLTLIFVFQSRLARYRVAHRWIRNGFLLFTLVWLGYIAGGQLSIVHVINYVKAPFDGADFSFYLTEPLIFVLAVYVVLSLILIGRGVFCGWLCPFGALQELSRKIGRIFRLPEWNPSPKVQRWMWLPKYGVAAVVIAVAFVIPEWSIAAEEVEPFKTAITAAFTRPWPYVTYAGFLLVVGLFTERAFCRFLCPLGATLALLDRLHLLTLLKRRPECGSPCHLCEHSCPVKAIEPTGAIVNAECFQCLDCQVEYYDDRRCPPIARERKVRERAAADTPVAGVPAYAKV
jgi:NosR/NirI family nitrous oxide reductase transcriptional regulator